MWELLLNGINLLGTGASIASFVSGFSFEKDLKQYGESLQNLERSMQRFERMFDKLHRSDLSNRNAMEDLHNSINNFRQSNTPFDQSKYVVGLENKIDSLQTDISSSIQNAFYGTIKEMKNVLDSFRVSQSQTNQIRSDLLQNLSMDPFKAGVTQYWDITQGGLYSLNKSSIIRPNIVPLLWRNPFSGQLLFGEIPQPRLDSYGIKIMTPHYNKHIDGHVYSEKYGIYVPSIYL